MGTGRIQANTQKFTVAIHETKDPQTLLAIRHSWLAA